MKLLKQLFGIGTAAPEEALEEARFIVVDVETTGLDPRRDELLSIGVVPARLRCIDLGEMREIMLHHEAAVVDKDNIVVHGITPTESAHGRDTAAALQEFLDYIGDHWLVAFHADFDRNMLARALKRHLGIRLENPFIDLAWLLPALFPASAKGRHTLDDWLGRFSIAAPYRHRAAADALVTAELLLVALTEARAQHYGTVQAIARVAEAQGKLTQMAQG